VFNDSALCYSEHDGRTFVKLRLHVVVALIAGVSLAGLAMRQASNAPLRPAYVDSTLFAVANRPVSIIVTAIDSRAAVRAVRDAGGQVTSDLWLIDGVAAQVSSDRLPALAHAAGVRSITPNRGVQAADATCSGPIPCTGRPGWVTDTREKKHEYNLTAPVRAPAITLRDGGLVAVSDNEVLLVNPDGTERARVATANLVGNAYARFESAPVVGADGTIYLSAYIPASVTAAKGWQVIALNPTTGSTRWKFKQADVLGYVAAALAPDGALYVVGGQNLYSLAPSTGQLLWKYTIKGASGYRPGPIVAAPTVGANGWIYLASRGETVQNASRTIRPRGHLHALNPAAGRMSNGTWKPTLMWKWTVVADENNPFPYSPLLRTDGALVVASSNNKVYAVNGTSGARIFRAGTTGVIQTQPALGADGSLYVATDAGILYGLNPNGSQRFAFRAASGAFLAAPTLAAGGQTVYAAVDARTLYAINTTNGTARWQYSLHGAIRTRPALDAEGTVFVGSDAKDLAILSPDGTLLGHMAFNREVTQAASLLPAGEMLVYGADNALYTIGRLPELWDGRSDVEPTDTRREWMLSNPVAIDVGADQIHDRAITGQGVTVAVVDSGVFFHDQVRHILGPHLAQQFLGQADFVGDGDCNGNGVQYLQQPGGESIPYCFTDYQRSIDRYGHGSHVAGIIWSQIRDYATTVDMGIAPAANILSVRVLDDMGQGMYADVIEGIQYVVANKATFNIRAMNLSLSADATVPYFVDPLNRAAERAWANGIVVLAAGGNSGAAAETITVPGNDPYVITVGAVDEKRTPGYWSDDSLPAWSATGPTLDGFAKPDVLAPGANIISFMYTSRHDSRSAYLAQIHPDHALDQSISLFRMSGTSMATAVASGVVALMLQANPNLTPDQVKYRLLDSARPALTDSGDLIYNSLQQGMGRIWAPDAVLGTFPAGATANAGMDINADLAHGYDTDSDFAFHYEGPVQKAISDDEQSYLYYLQDNAGEVTGLGAVQASSLAWIDRDTLASSTTSWSGAITWNGGMAWNGGISLTAGPLSWSGGRMSWSGGRMSWSGGRMSWSGGRMSWSGGRMSWSGGLTWPTGTDAYASLRPIWAGSANLSTTISTNTWVDDW
jgi:serine protease AprX